MRVVGIDGGITHLGVCVIDTTKTPGTCDHWEPKSIAKTATMTPCEVCEDSARWLVNTIDNWDIERVDLVIIESVHRQKVQSVGNALIGAIVGYCVVRGIRIPRMMMKAGVEKFKWNNNLYRQYLQLKGKKNYLNRKKLLRAFLKSAYADPPAATDSFDSVDALLMAVLGVKSLDPQNPWVLWLQSTGGGDPVIGAKRNRKEVVEKVPRKKAVVSRVIL